VRIGTWNLAGRGDARHLNLIATMDCDVLLLTEVSERLQVPAYDVHLGHLPMAPGRRWATVASRLPMSCLPDPHGASAMEDSASSVWGGDWNHALSGREWAGSAAGRSFLVAAVERLDLQVPTASLPHQLQGILSIDHVAVPDSWVVSVTHRHRALVGKTRLSDHDAYVVEASPRP